MRTSVRRPRPVPGLFVGAKLSLPPDATTLAGPLVAAPLRAGQKASEWAAQFDRLLVHLDVDVLYFVDTPLAENVRRDVGLRLHTLMSAIAPLLEAPNLATVTITEINPDHGPVDGPRCAALPRRWLQRSPDRVSRLTAERTLTRPCRRGGADCVHARRPRSSSFVPSAG